MNVEEHVDRLKLVKEALKLAKRASDIAFVELESLADELAALSVTEVWHEPLTLKEVWADHPDGPPAWESKDPNDNKIYWRYYTVTSKNRHGPCYPPGHPNAPPKDQKGVWQLGVGSNSTRDGVSDHGRTPKNQEHGPRCEAAWRAHFDASKNFHLVKSKYEEAIREMLEDI